MNKDVHKITWLLVKNLADQIYHKRQKDYQRCLNIAKKKYCKLRHTVPGMNTGGTPTAEANDPASRPLGQS